MDARDFTIDIIKTVVSALKVKHPESEIIKGLLYTCIENDTRLLLNAYLREEIQTLIDRFNHKLEKQWIIRGGDYALAKFSLVENELLKMLKKKDGKTQGLYFCG